jgi:predicted metalloprotease with PDZ domain
MIEKLEWSTAKGRLGVMVMNLTPELRKHFGAPEDRGGLVAHVESDTPAATAGIEVGDVIVGVHGKKIDTAPDVLSALAGVGMGGHAKLSLVRNGKARTLEATLASDELSSMVQWPSWLRSWMMPLDRAKSDADSTAASRWLDKLRELFAPNTGPVARRS